MKHEGMGKRYPKQDITHDINRAIEEDHPAAEQQRNAQRLIERHIDHDRAYKALTGRRIAQYEVESGITESELFPEGASILNIGDPWQTLDRVGVTTLEYETGDEHSFVSAREEAAFLEDVPYLLDELRRNITAEIPTQYTEQINVLHTTLAEFASLVETPPALDTYPTLAILAQTLTDTIRSFVPSVFERYPNMWYTARALGRGFEDIYLDKTTIIPAIEQAAFDQKGMSEQERQALRQRLIAEHRTPAIYTESTLIKGAFPDTPFEDHSFDRITSSWAISAHMFSDMSKSEFGTLWTEIDRLLTTEGAAYIWPMNYARMDTKAFVESIRTYMKKRGHVGIIPNSSYYEKSSIQWIKDVYRDLLPYVEDNSIETLIVLGTQWTPDTKKRIENHLYIPPHKEQDNDSSTEW
jgi:hypothetical protein